DVIFIDEVLAVGDQYFQRKCIKKIEEFIASGKTLVLVSHDRRFLENLSRATLWLSDGATHRLERGFAEFEPWRDDFVEHRESERHKLKRKIASETAWLHKGVTARRKRNQGRLRALIALRKKHSEQRVAPANVNLEASQAEQSGKLVVEAEHIAKSYAGPPVIEDFSVRIPRGARVGIVGPNGAGKTTLLNLLSGGLAPDSGTIRLGHNLSMASLDQKREQLDADATLQDALTGGGGEMVSVNGKARHVVGYMKDFLFLPEQARTPLGVLSGGERGRLMLARALARPSNLLVLDEPTAGVSPIVMDELFDRILQVRDSGVAVLMVEQNASQALAIADRGYVLVTGENRFSDSGQALLDDAEVRRSFLGG
ncbi:MAG: ATP-binding cassette domain-containing protein, partial [Alphaproteobacteria bacterium]|nr:ATP-binding cassette domain-containing protein [Alphaproteobacteria bacterium]